MDFAEKYPLYLLFIYQHHQVPALATLYLSMTIWRAFLFIAFFGSLKNRFSKIVTVYGRVPFFYYVLHFYLIHSIAMLLSFTRGHGFAEGAAGVPNMLFKFMYPNEGYSLAVTYLVWLFVVVLLYPACRWFSRYKQTHKQWWLSYL